MIGTCGLQLVPLSRSDRAAVPDHQGHDDALYRRIIQHARQPIPYSLAQALPAITMSCCQRLILLGVANVTGGPNTVLIQPGFVIKATGITKSTWWFQPHQQTPGLPGFRQRLAAIPAESNAPWHAHRRLA